VGEELARAVNEAVQRQLAALPESDKLGRARRAVALESVKNNGLALIVDSIEELIEVANDLAAEHVSVQLRDSQKVADQIKWAGALFIGHDTPEAAGDYLAGPSHVLPTGGAARYASPLGVYDFVARTSLISYTKSALRVQAQAICDLARAEGLEAHARAVESRLTEKD
jgi:histidinol dehydrogenase